MIAVYIFIAFLNGLVIGTSRSINGKLATFIGAFKASFWNHVGGFIFLTAILLLVGQLNFHYIFKIPGYTYLGGFFGALFVAINSFVFTRLGAVKTIVLVIAGQMAASLLIAFKDVSIVSTLGQLVGFLIILYGIYLAKSKREK